MGTFGSALVLNQTKFKHSSWKFLLMLSLVPLCDELLGSIVAVSIFVQFSQ